LRLVLTILKPKGLGDATHKKEFRIVVQCTTYQVASRCCQQVRCIAAAMRKLLCIMNTMLKKNQNWQPNLVEIS
jgi:hypothetical protein